VPTIKDNDLRDFGPVFTLADFLSTLIGTPKSEKVSKDVLLPRHDTAQGKAEEQPP